MMTRRQEIDLHTFLFLSARRPPEQTRREQDKAPTSHPFEDGASHGACRAATPSVCVVRLRRVSRSWDGDNFQCGLANGKTEPAMNFKSSCPLFNKRFVGSQVRHANLRWWAKTGGGC